MKIIQVHNYYQQAGGEDSVVEAELELLQANGHEVVTYYKRNNDITTFSNKLLAINQLLKASLSALWSHRTYREFRKILQTKQPDVVHCHNIFPVISPSIYWACAKENVPVVQTLHNYRLLCLNAFLFRQSNSVKCEDLSFKKDPKPKTSESGSICEKCLTKSFKWPGVKYGCYRDSKAGSLIVALMLFSHKLIGTWAKKVTAYIALTEFQKQKMIEGGIPSGKIFVKPNFIAGGDGVKSEVLSVKKGESDPADLIFKTLKLKTDVPCALFVGRLSPEKGCDVLIRAWARFQEKLTANSHEPIANQMPQLLIVGDGPECESLELLAKSYKLIAKVHFLGRMPKMDVLPLMRNAQFLALSSRWYEGFPMTIVEAFSCGTAVISSNAGGVKEVIHQHKNGLKFKVDDVESLSDELIWAFSHPEEMEAMGRCAREDFEIMYSAEVNYSILNRIYTGMLHREIVDD